MPRVVFAVDDATVDLVADDQVLAAALASNGWDCEARVWGSALDDLRLGDALVVRSTWDYPSRSNEFADWLGTLIAAPFGVVNPPTLMRWNVHKRYLLALAEAGVPIVPTVFLTRGCSTDLASIAAKYGWSELVVKPAISATAKGAARGAARDLQRHLDLTILGGDVLVQPLLRSVAERGEWSIVVIDGEITGAVLKRAAPGEWRVQSDFGGGYQRVEVTDAMRSITATVLKAIARVAPAQPVYARIDVVELEHRSETRLVVIEVEMIEPDLFFGLSPETVDALVAALSAHPDVR